VNVFFAGGGTGGHLYPALAIARALVAADARIHPFFIGARRGIERDVLPTTEFPFELLDLHPLYRSHPWKNWQTIAGGIAAWRRISALAHQDRPAALVATGGYVAGVALAYASVAKIPIVIQEQNSFPGATVRWFASRATQIHLGFPEAASHFKVGPQTSIFNTGNPIAPPPVDRPSRSEMERWWAFKSTLTNDATLETSTARVDSKLGASQFGASPEKTVLIFGGSQGARAINEVVGAWLENGGAARVGVCVIWSTGKANYETYKHLESERVRIRPYIAPMSDAYAAADFAVGRAGAMATAELAAWGIPAILIPLPTAAADHQTANARAIAAAGAAVMVEQRSLTVETLEAQIRRFADDGALLDHMRTIALQRARPDASQNIARHILTLQSFK
jgi:UDP-N-acetylglucosamine--N-acetylmuramyl-(pentapeptide) pyrophosphoryl-undecaprenol N-acetylglucosamine transferase